MSVAAPHTKPHAALKHIGATPDRIMQMSCTTHKAACGIETSRKEGVPPTMQGCTTNKAACGMSAPIGSLRSPLTDLSEKKAHRAQLNGKQVVWENVPRTRVKRSVIGRR